MRILVTGGSGFGGSGLVHALLERGHEVTVLDIIAPLEADKLADVIDHPNLTYKWKAIHDIKPSDIEDQDIVIHLQAQADVPMGFPSPYWTAHQNVMGTVALLEACRQVELDRVIFAGSGNEWGRPVYVPIDENHPLTPHNPYAWSKAAAELAFWAWQRCYHIPVVVMSNGVVIGPHMRREIFIFKWLWAIAHNHPLRLEGSGQTRDITYVTDVIDAWVLAIESPRDKVIGHKFQVSFGEEHSVQEILNWCFEITGITVSVMQAPYRPGEEGQREYFTNKKARDVLGYNPKVGPKQSIALTWEWIKSLI
jgi:UDP-glucose 4-epimerase